MKPPIIAVAAYSLFLLGARCEAADLKMQQIPTNFQVSPKILGGEPAKKQEWPATLIFQTDTGDYCTATAVGDRVLLTAAHCIIENPTAQVTWNNEHINVNCQPHPEYNDNPRFPGDLRCHLRIFSGEFTACTADVALCVTEGGKKLATTVGQFERIKKDPPATVVGGKITLLGYGCVDANERTNGILSIGVAKVAHLSSPAISASADNTLKDFILTDGAGVCLGDSGGAGYSSSDAQSREIVGINSRGNLSTGSDLVNVLDARIAKFFDDFSRTKSVQICGLDPKAVNCKF